MMATCTALGAVRSTLEYFLSEAGYAPRAPTGTVGRARYYAHDTAEHLHASEWYGQGAAALRLTGRVRARDFERVLRGEVPGTGVVLRRNRDGAQEHRTGWDLTFSAPKSVSVAWGVQGDERVLGAFVEAVRSALHVLEARHLETRVHDPETKRRKRESADGLVAATFVHVSNRNDEPQVHLHAVVVNMTRSAAGEWRSVEPSSLGRHARLLGHIAGDALAKRLRGLGYALEARRIGRRWGFEIAGYPRWLLDRFSTRRRELLRHLAETGRRASARARQAAAFATRAAKSGLRTPALRERWREAAEADPHLRQALAAALYRSQREAADDAPGPSALETVCAAIEHLSERGTLLRERDILSTALALAPGRHGLDALEAALAKRLRDRHLLPARAYRGGGRAFVATREFADERALVVWMKAARDTGRVLARADAVAARLEGARLTTGQRAAVRLILLAPHRAVAVQGFAGTGKTTMLREVAGLAGGVPVFGLAPSAAAARVLGHEAGIGTRTADWFLTRFGDLRTDEASPATRALARELCGDGLLVVDECSMLSTAQLLALTRLAERIGVARVVLCGDHRQLQSVRPGQPFRLLQEAGMPTAVMDEIVRQRNPVIRRAVRDALSGRPGRALARLAERIEEVPAQALAETAAREFLALPDAERAHTLLVAPTNALRREINAGVREGLVEEGKIRGPALLVERLIDLHLTAPEKARPSSYEPGDEVAFVQDLLPYRVRNAEACVVTGVDGERVALRHPDGTPRHIAPATGRIRYHFKVCESAPIELRAGDRIRWTHNDHRRGLLNGETATVARIAGSTVTLRTEGGAKRVLEAADPQLRHIDHAYTSTTHAAQGSTCGRVIAVLDADPMPLTHQLTFYVQISRAREEVVLLTDDREQLIETLEEQSGERVSAHEALGATPGGGGVAARARRRDYERARREWRRVRRRARSERRPERYASGYAAVHAQVARLDEDDALPEYMRGFVDDWLGDHERTERARRDIETVMRAAQRLGRGTPAEETEDACDDAGASASGHGGAGEALALARTIVEDAIAYGPHLDAEDGWREAFGRAHSALEAAVFHSAHTAVADEATEADTIARYAAGYPALLEHARTLTETPLALPRDTLDLAADVVRQETGWREEVDQLRAVIEGVRTWERVRPAGVLCDEAGSALLARARAVRTDEPGSARHLAADRELCEAFDAVHAALEDAAFASEHETVRWQAAQGNTILFYAPDHAALVARATRLDESDLPLNAGTIELVDEVLRENTERRAERARIEGFISVASTREAAPGAEARWDDSAAALLEQGRTLQEDTAALAAHFEADDALRAAFEAALAGLETAAFASTHAAVDRHVTASGKLAFYAPDHAALVAHATRLDESDLPLNADTLGLVAEVLRDDTERRAERARIEGFISVASTREAAPEAEARWDKTAAALLEQGRTLQGDTTAPAAHFEADDALRPAFEAALAGLERAAFASTYASVERYAIASGKMAFYAPDHAALVAHATHLDESDLSLGPDTRARVSSVLRNDETRRTEREHIEAFIAEAKPWKDDGATSANSDRPRKALLEQGAAILDNASASSRAHFEGDPALRQRVDTAWGALQGAALCHDYHALEEEAARRGHPPFLVAGYDALLGRVRSLRKRNVLLPTGAQRAAVRVVRENVQARKTLHEINAFFGAAELRHRERVRGSPWGDFDDALWRRAVEMDDINGRYWAHLHAFDFLPGRFARAHYVLKAEHEARVPSATRDPQGARALAYHLDCEMLACHVNDLTARIRGVSAGADAPAADQASDASTGADPQRALEEFFAWCAFRELERERESDPVWNALDAALLDHAGVLNDTVTAGGHPRLGDDDSRRRIERTYAELTERHFAVVDEQLRVDAESKGTLVCYLPRYRAHLERAQRLHESELPFSAEARARFDSVLRDDATHRGERSRIEAFIAAAQPGRGDGTSESNETPPDKTLLDEGRTLLEDSPRFKPHLNSDVKLRWRFRLACGAVFGAAIRSDHGALEKQATQRATTPFHVPGHDALLGRVRWLREHAVPLPEDAQRVADRVLEEDSQARKALRDIGAFFEEAEHRHRERIWGSPWGGRDDVLRRRALEMQGAESPYRVHLNAVEFMPDRLTRAWWALEAGHATYRRRVAPDPEGRRERARIPDYGPLAARVMALSQAVIETRASEPAVGQAGDAPAVPDQRRALEEFFAWCEFRELERERDSGNKWSPLDGALQMHARGLYLRQTDDGPPLFDDAELQQRVVQAHADLEGQWFIAVDETLRDEAAADNTIARYHPMHAMLLQRAQQLSACELPLSAQARKRIEAVLGEEAGNCEEIREIARFAEDVRDWKRRRTPNTRWDAEGERLLTRGRGASERIPHFHEHVASEKHLGAAFATARGTLEGAKFVSAYARVQALAKARRTKSRRLDEYRKLCLDARTLKADASIILPTSDRARVDEVLRHPTELHRGAVSEPKTKTTDASTAPAAQPGAGGSPQGSSTPPHAAGPSREVPSGTPHEAGAGWKGRPKGRETPPDSAIEAHQTMATEHQAPPEEAQERKEERKAARKRRSERGLDR